MGSRLHLGQWGSVINSVPGTRRRGWWTSGTSVVCTPIATSIPPFRCQGASHGTVLRTRRSAWLATGKEKHQRCSRQGHARLIRDRMLQAASYLFKQVVMDGMLSGWSDTSRWLKIRVVRIPKLCGSRQRSFNSLQASSSVCASMYASHARPEFDRHTISCVEPTVHCAWKLQRKLPCNATMMVIYSSVSSITQDVFFPGRVEA